MSILEIEKLCAYYGKRKIIDEVSFSAENGEFTAILGQNGSGKTTLLHSVCGFIRSEGRITVNGQDMTGANEKKRSALISYIPQVSGIKDGYSLFDVVLMGANPHLDIFSYPSAEDKKKALEMIELVGLSGKEEKDFSHLSEGEKQLAITARALLQDAPVMLMDEPDSALDFNNRHKILKTLRSIIRTKDYAGLIAIHSPEFALNYCDRILILKNGKIAADFKPENTGKDKTEEYLSLIYDNIKLFENEYGYTVAYHEK